MSDLDAYFDGLPFAVDVDGSAYRQYECLLNEGNGIAAIYGHCHNGKWYIGQTSQFDNLTKRFGTDGNRYLAKNEFGEYAHPKFARAIKKYGWESFSHHIFGFYSKDAANDAERYWISKMDSQGSGYNTAPGGQHMVDHHPQNAKISAKLKGHSVSYETRKKISESLRHSEKYKSSRQGLEKYLFKAGEDNIAHDRSRYGAMNSHPQYGAENPFYGKTHNDRTREIIRESRTSRAINGKSIEKMKKSLAAANAKIANERKEHPERFIGNSKPLAMMDANGNILKTFKSSSAAAKYANVSRQLITRCARGKAYTAGGYHWKFILPEEVIDDI